MSRSYHEDYLMGKSKETELFDKVKQFFNDPDMKKTEGRYAKSDFHSDKYIYELKARTNKYLDYPTTLLPAKKIFSNNHIFLFNYIDGLYYIMYDEELFNTFEKKPFRRRPRTGFCDSVQEYIYIPIDKLLKIE